VTNTISSGFGITKAGNGTLILSGNNSYTGVTAVNAGLLTLSNASAVAGTSGITVANGGRLSMTANALQGKAVTITGNGTGTGAVIFQVGSATTTATFTLAGNAAIRNQSFSDLTINTAIGESSAGSVLTLTGNSKPNSAFNGSAIFLGGNNTFSGGLVIDSLKVRPGNSGWAGAGNGLAGVTLQNGGGIDLTSADRTIAGNLTMTDGFIYSSANARTISAANFLMANGIVGANATLAGSGALIKSGAGTVTLTGNNTYSGDTLVSGGTLVLSSALALQNSALDTSGAGGISLSGVTTPTFGGLKGSGNLASVITGNYNLVTGITLNAGSGANNSYSGVISDGAAGMTLTKNGTGTQVLSGINTYTGATTINAGTLSIAAITNGGDAGALGNSTNAAGNLVLGSGTLEYSGSANDSTDRNFTLTAGTTSGISVSNSTVSLTISGTAAATTGALTKSGAGTLILSGANAYTGATTINAGTLQIGAGSTTGSISSSSAITNNGTLVINRSNAITLSNTISGTGGLLKSGAGDLTLSGNNSYTGGTTLTNSVAGNLTMGANNALGNGALTFNATATARLLLNGTNQTVTGLTLLGSNVSVIQNEGSSSSSLGTITFNLADGVTSNSTSNFYFRDSSDMGANRGKLALVKTGNGTLDFSTMNALSQGYSGGLTVNGGTFSYNSTAATAALGNSTAGGTITLGGGTLNYTGSTDRSISNNITLTAATSSTLNNANSTITVSGTIGGSGNITKGGAGTLILSGANAYTGDTIISAGTLQIGAGSTTGSISSSSAITNNGTLVINRSDAITLSNTISGTGNLTKLGTGNLTIGGASANTYNGTTTVSVGNLTLDKTSGVVAVGGDLVLNGSSKLTYNGTKNEQIANTASVTINGSQSVFNGSAWGDVDGAIGVTETIGSLTVTNGQFNTGNTGSLGNWTVTGAGVFDGSTGDTRFLGFSGSSISFNSLSLTAMTGTTIISTADSFVMGGASTTAVTTLSVGSGGLTLDGSTLGLNKGLTSTSQLGSRLILDGNITTTGSSASSIASNNGGTIGISDILLSSTAGSVTRTITTGSGANLTISVPITNGNATTAGIIKDGLGTLTLSGNNTYNGPTSIIDGGTLNANVTNALPTQNGRTAVSIDATGTGSSTLALGASQSVASLTGNTTSIVALGSNTITIGNTSGNTTYAGRITGGSSSALVKDGASTQVLTGNNTGFTGTTTVNSGTLQAATTNALANTSQVVLNSGGSFLVTADDAIGTNTDIELNGGTLAFGAAGYDGHVGALTLSANSTIDLGTSSNGVLLRFTNINWNNPNALLSIYNWTGNTEYSGNPGGGLDQVVIGNATTTALSTSQLQQIHFYSGIEQSSFIANAFQITSGTYNREIIAVPETETYFYAVALLAGVVIQYLRRRAKR
jgi:autotransporter-associated beta strand protein